MIKRVILLGVIILGLNACEEKEVSLYPSFQESAVFNIKTESFEYAATIDASVISEAVNDAVEDNESIERVVIEGLWFELTPKEDTSDKSITLDFDIKSWDSDEYIPVLDDLTFDIKKGKVLFLDKLKENGVAELKDQINAIAKGLGQRDVSFKVSGEVSPQGGVVDVELKVVVNATVIYKTEIGM
nr:hypothetical protein [uncultured Carboxylicivirga sp.]